MTFQPRVTTEGAQLIANDATKLRAFVAEYLRALKQRTWRNGYSGIEDMRSEDVAKLPVAVTYCNDESIPTVFATIGEAMVMAGYEGDVSTVGGVTEGLLGRNDPDAAKKLAHDIGCFCEPVTSERAASAIEALG